MPRPQNEDFARRCPKITSGEATSRAIFSVDVEDWFHILDVPSTPPIEIWDSLPSRMEKNFLRLLDIFSDANVETTCFFLGWVAKRFPHLVREAQGRGHEIASHGFGHQLVHRMSPTAFRKDIVLTKMILEDVTGALVRGYRAPGFSTTSDVPWFFEEVVLAGYRYDSSVFPMRRDNGGLEVSRLDPHSISTDAGGLLEFPMTIAHIAGRRICVFGGGYLRLSPVMLTKCLAKQVLAQNRPVITYIHPREIDPDHPRLPMQLRRRFMSYVNIGTTEAKIKQLLSIFPFTSFRAFISDTGLDRA